MDEVKRGRGRPKLSPEEREKRKIENEKRANEIRKENGWAAQKKYKEGMQKISLFIPLESKPALDKLLEKTGLSKTQLFVQAVEEKYDVKLKNDTN